MIGLWRRSAGKWRTGIAIDGDWDRSWPPTEGGQIARRCTSLLDHHVTTRCTRHPLRFPRFSALFARCRRPDARLPRSLMENSTSRAYQARSVTFHTDNRGATPPAVRISTPSICRQTRGRFEGAYIRANIDGRQTSLPPDSIWDFPGPRKGVGESALCDSSLNGISGSVEARAF